MARASKVSLSHIAIPGNHSIAFPDNVTRDAWYDSREPYVAPNLSYVRDTDIQLSGVLDNFRSFNFGYYDNEVGERIYFRIIDLVYLSEGTTKIVIEKDLLMTYLPTSILEPSFIERSNEAPTSIYDSDVPEIQYHGGYSHTLLDTFGTNSDFAFFLQLSGDYEPESQKKALTNYFPKNFNDSITEEVAFASMFRVFTALPPFNEFEAVLGQYMTAGTGDRLISAGAFPYADVSYNEVITSTTMLSNVTSVRATKSVNISTSINTRVAKDNVTVVIAEVDNFGNQIEIPITELSGGSLNLVSVSDPITQQRHYAVLSGADGDNELKYRITVNIGASLPSMNLPYYMAARNIETDLAAQQTNNLIGGASGALTGAVQGAAMGSLGGPVGMAAGAAAGASGAILSTATNALQNQVSVGAALEKASRLTPTVSGTATGFGVFANRSVGVNIFLKEPTGSGLSQLVDYYRFFGYNKSRILTPNVKSGTKFYKGNINGNFPGASAADTSVLRALFTSGVWIWANEDAFFSY